MPVQKCVKNGKSGWRWGKSGKCYTGNGGRAKAAKQGAAIKAAGFQEHDINMRSSGMLFQRITTNFTGAVRNDTMEGRDYLVAPMIMMVEGVHEGSNGPLYYPADEISKIPAVWNTKPIIVYHPQENGMGVSACDPDILTNRKVGVIMNTTIGEVEVERDKKKVKLTGLKAEAWLEVDRMNKVDERIAEAIEKNTMMELSTGLFTDNENMEGVWEGEAYTAIARNYRPDHLALLPDLVGACSIEDGAGFLRLNEEKKTIEFSIPVFDDALINETIKNNKDRIGRTLKKRMQEIINNEMSHNSIRSLLSSLLRVNNDDLWIEEVWDGFFIYEDGGKLYKQNYKMTSNSVNFEGAKEEVVRVVEFRTKDGTFIANRRRSIMDKEKMVKALIENENTLWAEDDKDALMGLDEKVLAKMSPVENEENNGVEGNEDDNKGEVNANADDNKDDNKGDDTEEVANMTAEEYIDKKVPTELKGVLRNGLSSYKADKVKLIKVITANKKNTFTKKQLEEKELDELKSLAALAVNTEEQEAELETLNYGGQGDPVHNEAGEEPMDIPVLSFEGKS